MDCTEAIATDGVTFYKFGNRNDAAAFSRSLGSDGYQSDWIVVEFTDPAFTAQDRQMLGGFVDDLWGSD
ncbi:hypothetical protein [Quadrisphaera sp. DSM 44207]|uniref:hypothetical protein n=1 Tax=Quadrisphaera sp. DSM 44207 TaxID=1881057 RepID=UPI00115FAAC6|nr:hypothetical protein [Quadrisphaera sp. DSM 44207]